jgi:hypothetical protein
MAAPKKLLVAKASFACEIKGHEVLIYAGHAYLATHPAVKGREQLFEAEQDRGSKG